MKYYLGFLVLTGWIGLASPADAVNPDMQNYRRAFALINSGHVLEADVFAVHGHDAVLNKIIHAIVMAQPGNNIGFGEMSAFVTGNPEWPGLRGIEAMAEQKIPSSVPATRVVEWFAAYPPVTLTGFYRYIDALNAVGQSAAANDRIRARWVENEFSADELTAFRSTFHQYIGEEQDWKRLDRLLWKGDAANAKRLYPYIDTGVRALADARLALANKSFNVDGFVDRVPSDLQSDAGLLYERLRWYVRNNRDDRALALLRNDMPDDPIKLEAWWDQRQIMARRLLDKKDYGGAYSLAVNHGHIDNKHLTDAEFLCGWLALRYLNEPDDARQHFQNLYDHSGTPISRARGAYWLGRAYEVLGKEALAQQAYEIAADLNVTYYGQLAAAKIYESPTIKAKPEPTIPAAIRNNFYNREMVHAVERLAAIGERDRAHAFFKSVVDAAQQRSEFALLTELAYRIERPDYAIEAGKAASQKNMLMAAGGFPLLGRNVPRPPEPAFTHALIRQESMFNPEARSPVGAEGLMQLMPATAKSVAKKIGMKYKPAKLTEIDTNLRLGTSFVQDQISNFDGSYVLALAGYNAGPRRVREWMAEMGDPRRPDVDVIDWVESIPNYETRNYVQRIIESLQIYRARLAGGEAPLQIVKDLKR